MRWYCLTIAGLMLTAAGGMVVKHDYGAGMALHGAAITLCTIALLLRLYAHLTK